MTITDTNRDPALLPKFFGLSTDTKPSKAPIGATFYETDTGVRYVWTGGAWVVARTSTDAEKANQKAAFGELLIAEPTPVVQLQFPYNINTDLIEKRENNAGTITQADGMAVMQSGASANSAAHMLSVVPLKYEPGQGALVRFTALFTTGVANSIQVAGIGEVGDGLFFGFNGATFSILRKELGQPEVQTLTITTGAVTATGTITINLDSVAKTVEVAQNDTVSQVAVKVGDADFSDTGLGWSTNVHNATVIFRAWSDGDKAGTFSLVDTDTTGTVGSFAETITGASTTNEWIAQTLWNIDPADGSSHLPALDPTKGNVYQIRYQWLGFGLLSFAIENPANGKFIDVHQIRYANANTAPSLQNPTLPLHIMSKNTSNTSNLTVKTSSMAGFVEGAIEESPLQRAASGTSTAVGTTELPLISVKNDIVHQSKLNRVQIQAEYLSVATEGTKPIIIRIRLNPTLTGTPAFAAFDAAVSVASVDTGASGLTGGEDILTIILGKTDSELIFLNELKERLHPGDAFAITAEATSGTNHEVDAALSWGELF